VSTAELSVTSPDLDRAIAQLDAKGWERAALPTVRNVIRKSVNVVRKNVRSEARAHRKSGKMAGSIRTRFSATSTGWRFQGSIKATGAVANLIVGGVSPHHIALGGKVMPIWGGSGRRGGQWRGGAGMGITGFARFVDHPGFAGDPFVDRGIAESEPAIAGFMDDGAKTIAREYAYRMERG
jgi:hypothetical protein